MQSINAALEKLRCHSLRPIDNNPEHENHFPLLATHGGFWEGDTARDNMETPHPFSYLALGISFIRLFLSYTLL